MDEKNPNLDVMTITPGESNYRLNPKDSSIPKEKEDKSPNRMAQVLERTHNAITDKIGKAEQAGDDASYERQSAKLKDFYSQMSNTYGFGIKNFDDFNKVVNQLKDLPNKMQAAREQLDFVQPDGQPKKLDDPIDRVATGMDNKAHARFNRVEKRAAEESLNPGITKEKQDKYNEAREKPKNTDSILQKLSEGASNGGHDNDPTSTMDGADKPEEPSEV